MQTEAVLLINAFGLAFVNPVTGLAGSPLSDRRQGARPTDGNNGPFCTRGSWLKHHQRVQWPPPAKQYYVGLRHGYR